MTLGNLSSSALSLAASISASANYFSASISSFLRSLTLLFFESTLSSATIRSFHTLLNSSFSFINSSSLFLIWFSRSSHFSIWSASSLTFLASYEFVLSNWSTNPCFTISCSFMTSKIDYLSLSSTDFWASFSLISTLNLSIKSSNPSKADFICTILFSTEIMVFWALLWLAIAALWADVNEITSLSAFFWLALAWSINWRIFVMPLTAFWCLSDAALRVTSSSVISFLLSSLVGALLLRMLSGVGLNTSGFPPVGNSSTGNLSSGY